VEPTIPLFWSTISMNWPITNGTDWIRLTSSCALRSSRFRFFCSSIMYSSYMSANSSCRCNSFCRVYRSSCFTSVPAITLVSGRNVFTDITGAIPEDTTPDISISGSISPSLSVTYGTFLCFSLCFCLSCPRSACAILCKQLKIPHKSRSKITQLSQRQTSAQAGSSSRKKVNCSGWFSFSLIHGW